MPHAGAIEETLIPHDASVKASEILQCPEYRFFGADFLECVNSFRKIGDRRMGESLVYSHKALDQPPGLCATSLYVF